MDESQLPARELGLQLYSMEVSRTDKFEGAFKEATKAGSGALAVTQNALVNSNQKRITDLAAKNRLPAIYNRGDWVVSGGLMSYGADSSNPPGAPHIGRQDPERRQTGRPARGATDEI